MLALPLLLMGCEKALPTPQQDAQTRQIAELVRAEIAKINPSPTMSPQPRLTPDPTIIANISEETQLRQGVLFVNADNEKFMRIHRKDDEPITKGLTSDSVAIETWKKPIISNLGDGTWEIVFTEREAPSPAPSITARP